MNSVQDFGDATLASLIAKAAGALLRATRFDDLAARVGFTCPDELARAARRA